MNNAVVEVKTRTILRIYGSFAHEVVCFEEREVTNRDIPSDLLGGSFRCACFQFFDQSYVEIGGQEYCAPLNNFSAMYYIGRIATDDYVSERKVRDALFRHRAILLKYRDIVISDDSDDYALLSNDDLFVNIDDLEKHK